ncbi:MAG: cyclic pyranopterin monophosphate synthase MoaC, partial [Euryarchaeota archaeon]|nr:cyclic pyranopterin monophosphate synthase MoaC [Euryarchaeota archaeon]
MKPQKGGRGEVRMVDVGSKPRVRRRAVASGRIALRPGTLRALRLGQVPKGDVLGVARVAAITAVKRTSELLPLCHPLALTRIDVDLRMAKGGVEARVGVEARERTGVEMEALVAV